MSRRGDNAAFYDSINAYPKQSKLKQLWRRLKRWIKMKCPWCGKEIEVKSQSTVKKVANKGKAKPKKLGDNVKAK